MTEPKSEIEADEFEKIRHFVRKVGRKADQGLQRARLAPPSTHACRGYPRRAGGQKAAVEEWARESDEADPHRAERPFLFCKAKFLYLASRAVELARGLDSSSPEMDDLEATEARVHELLELSFDRTGADALVDEDIDSATFGQILVPAGDIERWQRLAFWPAGQINKMEYVDIDLVIDLTDRCQAKRRELEGKLGATIDDALSWQQHVRRLEPGGVLFGSAAHRRAAELALRDP